MSVGGSSNGFQSMPGAQPAPLFGLPAPEACQPAARAHQGLMWLPLTFSTLSRMAEAV